MTKEKKNNKKYRKIYIYSKVYSKRVK